MADSHAHDPNAAPVHSEVRERFAAFSYVLAAVLGLAAASAGIVLGIIWAND